MFNTPYTKMSEREIGPTQTENPRVKFATMTKVRTEKPSLYKVYILNDDFTPMDFVVDVLETIFNKGHEEALRIMLHVHHKGSGLCGVFTHDVAETKVSLVLRAARAAQHPLQCKMEKE
jgi:ATP-dependent Clp protease adaptor protein ClpS